MYILHLQNVPDSANETIIRRYFKDLKISDGGVEIVGGIYGDVLINFDDEADILQALTFGEKPIHGCRIKILLAEQADKEQIIAKALKPPKLSSKRSKSSKSSNVPESSTCHAATPETAALGNHPDTGYAAAARSSSAAADDGQTAVQRGWSTELKTKLLSATTQRPQLASDIVRNALLKMNEGQSPTPIDAPYTQPPMPPLSTTARWGSQVAPPPSALPDLTAEMLKNILRSTNAVPPPSPVGAPYNHPVPAPQLLGSAGLTTSPRMPPGQQWGTQVTRPRGPRPVPVPHQWRVLPNTSLPPPGFIRTPFRQRVPAPTLRPPMATSSKVVPSPSTVAVHVPTTLPLAVPPNSAQALGSAQKRSRWGGMAVGASIPHPITQIVSSSILPKTASTLHPPGSIPSAKPIIVKANKAQNSAKVSGNTAMNIKQKPSSTPQVKSRNTAVNPAVKRERTPAQPAKIKAANTNAEAIVITDSDSDSESEVKQKKRKIANVSAIRTGKSESGRDKIQKVYRSKRSRSRSRSRGRSRSGSRSRQRSTSRGRNRSRSRGRNRSRSRGKDRSRSRGRDKSRGRDGGREQQQKPRNYDQDRTRKPGPRDAEPKVPSLLEVSTKKPVSLEMFKNDPNSVTVHNVAETVTILVFRDFFYGHPIVKDGLVLTPSNDIPNCQTGYIKFVHNKDVEAVKQLSFTTLDGRKLLIKSCCEEENSPAIQTSEVGSKVGAESEGHGGPPTRPVIGHRETLSKPLKVLKISAPKESPFGLLGASEHITSYHVGIRGFKPGTTACEMWSWFGGPDGHVKGIIVSHRIRKDDDELAFVMYGSKALRNTFRGPKHGPQLVWHRYSEKAAIHKLISNDVCYLTETTLLKQDREVSKEEIKHLRKFRPEGPTKPPLQQQEEDVPQTESSKPGQSVPQQQTQHCSLAPWKKLSYICLHETPKGISASKVWSWYGGEKGRAEGVILANCKSKNELKGDRFNIAFVGFRDPYVVQQEIDKRCSGQRYSSDGTMRFLARLPDSAMIFQSSTSGQDRVLPKNERLQLRGKYLTQEEIIEKSKSEDAQRWKEFELSEEFGKGLFFLQINEPELKELTASEAWSWYPPETCMTRGAAVVKNPDGTPAFAYVAFSDNITRNKAFAEFRSTAGKAWKASWAYTVRQFSMYLIEKAQEIFVSTKSGIDRSVTKEEKAYCLRMLQTSPAWNNNMISRAFITDPVEYAKEVEKDAAIGAAAAADKDDELFYLHLKRVPPKVTACEVWNWFYGSTGNSKSAVVVYGTNGIAASAYVGFEREIDRDDERPKQKFSKVCTYRGRGVRLLSLTPGCKTTESTTTGVDRVLSEHDLGVIRWKLREIDGVDKKGETAAEDGESTSSDHPHVVENYKERPWLTHPQVEKKYKKCAPLPGLQPRPQSEPPHQQQGERNKQGNTVTPNNQSTCVQVQGKQQPEHSSSQEKDTFKTPTSAPQGKHVKIVTHTEQSRWVQGKSVETVTPYEQSPWVKVEQKPQPQYSSLEPWQKLSYLCLYETPKGNTASEVWSWFGAEKEKVQCVILAHCTSQNELQDGRFHVAFVGFREPCILKKELDRLGQSKWYSPDEAMRFLARLPYDCPIFRALLFGHDRLLSKKVRMELQKNFLTEEECVEKQHSELKPEEILTSTPNPEDFTLSEENVHGMLFVQHRVLPKTCTACKVWTWHQLDSGKSKGVILLKGADGTPHSAFVAYEDAKARAESLAKGQFTSKASWTCVVRRVSVLADRGFQVLMSTTLGKDRGPTEAEKAYMLHIRSTNTTSVSSDPMSTDTEPANVLSTAAAIAIASGQHTKTSKKEIDIAATAAADKSDELFYLRIRKLPEKATACQVWSWFQGSLGNSKSAVVVCGANNVTVCAYVGFEKEMHRDMGVTNQRFSKACTYHSRSVFLVDLNPSFKVTESTVTGVDQDLTADDFAVIRYKLQQNAVEKKKQKDGNTNPGPSCQQQPHTNTQSTSMQASNSNGQSNPIEGHPSYSTQYPAQQSVSTQDHQPKKDIDKPVHQAQMAIHKPVQQAQIDKPVHQPQMDIQQLLECVQNLHEAENTIYFRLVKLRPNITAGEIWSWFRGSRGPTRCATLVRDFDGTALFAYVGFVSDHTSYLENLELGTFSLCGPKARNIELASLHPSAQIIQSTKEGDKAVLPETLSLFRAGIMGGAKAGTGT